jgi:integrase
MPLPSSRHEPDGVRWNGQFQHQLRGASPMASGGPTEGYRRLLGDPLQQVQRLLGHASLATTSLYLDHIVTRADTVDAAVEELLALLPGKDRP